MLALHGTGVGAGIAIGKARIISKPGENIARYEIPAEEVVAEINRLQTGVKNAITSLISAGEKIDGDIPEEVAALLETHAMILQDPMLLDETVKIIREKKINAEYALSLYGKRMQKVFDEIPDPYLSSKSADVAQVIQRVQGALIESDESPEQSLSNQPDGAFDGEIIVANDLTPADTIALKKHRISGFLTNLGGPTSHTAILARSMQIPAIVGLHGALNLLRTGDLLIVDGKRGVIMAGPDAGSLEAYQRRREKIFRRSQALEALREADSVSLDGQKVGLFSNVELPEEVAFSARQNAEGVGLYRTEFLFMNREELPDEEEQYQVYSEVLKSSDKPVTIRTLDLGADKQVDGGRTVQNLGTNPALGLRAIRLCLHDVGLFKPHLRAIFRASIHGKTRLMVPMLSNVEELDQLFTLIEEVKQELAAQGFAFDDAIPIGGMIEVPAAAVTADIFAHKLDFLSIGTNDLIQYTLAIDRIDDEVNYLYDPLHPSILRLVKMVIEAGQNANIPVSMCGEMAGNPEFTRVLLALGLREFSMDPASLLEVKQRVRISDVTVLEAALPEIMGEMEPGKLRQKVAELNQ